MAEGPKDLAWLLEFDKPGCPVQITLSKNGTHNICGVGGDYIRICTIKGNSMLVLPVERLCVVKP